MLDKWILFDYIFHSTLWRDVRAVEGARLESVCTFIAYRGFESLSLRHTVYAAVTPAGFTAMLFAGSHIRRFFLAGTVDSWVLRNGRL